MWSRNSTVHVHPGWGSHIQSPGWQNKVMLWLPLGVCWIHTDRGQRRALEAALGLAADVMGLSNAEGESETPRGLLEGHFYLN